LVGIPGERDLGRAIDVAVVDHGYRSVTGVPYPLDPNVASMDELTAIPGIGSSTAGDIVVNRPYDSASAVPSPEVDFAAFTGSDPIGGRPNAE
jgi:radical SAM superfamily enzyme with C-terminal helix-hairpin-helix motif